MPTDSNSNTGTETTSATTTNKAEVANAFAALILADADVDITAEKLQKLLKAANIDVEPIWATIFAKAIEHKNIKDILTTISTSAPEVGRQQAVEDGKEKEEDGGEAIVEGEDDSDMEGGMLDLFG